MRKNRQQFFFGSLALFCLTAGGWHCSKEESSQGGQGVTPVTYVSVINAAPYGPSVDIYLNSTLVTTSGSIAPGSYSQQYAQLAPGTYAVTFDKTGTDSVLAEIPSSAFDSAAVCTLILYNTGPDGTGVIDAAKITDNINTASPTAANYRFFNLSPDVPSVDLYFNGTLVQSRRMPADNVTDTTLDQFQTLAPNSYTIVAKIAGGDSTLVTTSGGVDLSAGNVFTIFLTGTNSASGGNHLSLHVQQVIL